MLRLLLTEHAVNNHPRSEFSDNHNAIHDAISSNGLISGASLHVAAGTGLKKSNCEDFAGIQNTFGHGIFSTEAAVTHEKQPSLKDLGLDQPALPAAQPGKISIRSLQLESEQENLSTSGQPRSHEGHAATDSNENVLGIVGFVLSIVGLLSAGCISPIAMIVCFFALGKKPVGLAVAGLILSVLGTIGIAVAAFLFAAGLIIG